MPRSCRLAVAGLAMAMVAAVSCGGNSLPAADQTLADAIEAEIASAATGSADPETHTCYATGAVTALGGAAEIEQRFDITAADVSAGAPLQTWGLSRDDAMAVATELIECVDQARLLSADSGITRDQAACLLDEVDEGLGLDLSVAAGLIGDGSAELLAEYDAHLESIGPDLLEARLVCFN